jgi:hypothetical protein
MRDSKGVEKLGISRNSLVRRKQVDDSMDNVTIKLLFEMKLFFAGLHEKKLHRIYEDKWKPRKLGSGRLEFFNLNWFDVQAVKLKLIGIYFRQRISILSVAFFLCFFLFLVAEKL